MIDLKVNKICYLATLVYTVLLKGNSRLDQEIASSVYRAGSSFQIRKLRINDKHVSVQFLQNELQSHSNLMEWGGLQRASFALTYIHTLSVREAAGRSARRHGRARRSLQKKRKKGH